MSHGPLEIVGDTDAPSCADGTCDVPGDVAPRQTD